jgi:hypothetical protein
MAGSVVVGIGVSGGNEGDDPPPKKDISILPHNNGSTHQRIKHAFKTKMIIILIGKLAELLLKVYPIHRPTAYRLRHYFLTMNADQTLAAFRTFHAVALNC